MNYVQHLRCPKCDGKITTTDEQQNIKRKSANALYIPHITYPVCTRCRQIYSISINTIGDLKIEIKEM